MGMAHRRHDISDRVWLLLEPHLLGRAGRWGGVAQDNRRFINAVFWILRTGALWRDWPPDYGDWKNTHRRFCRWRDKGLWGALPHPANHRADHLAALDVLLFQSAKDRRELAAIGAQMIVVFRVPLLSEVRAVVELVDSAIAQHADNISCRSPVTPPGSGDYAAYTILASGWPLPRHCQYTAAP